MLSLAFVGGLLSLAFAHKEVAVDPGDSWQVRHMKLEHGVDTFDPKAFFLEHDSDNTHTWDRDDILRLYGLQKMGVVGDGTGMGTSGESYKFSEKTRETVYSRILELLDTNHDGKISLDEWRKFCEEGNELPDFGLGTGHHGDYEYEYEVHHWNEFHAQNDPDVKFVHPEDEAHEKLYHQNEHSDNGWGDHDASWARIKNIPKKFLKQRV